MMRFSLTRLLIGAAFAALPALAAAEAWPSRPVRLVIAAAPGGGTDIVARLIAQQLVERLGQPWITDNRGGGGGSVAAEAVARAPADGYTLLMTNDQLVVQASFQRRAGGYDALRDFIPVALIGRTPIVLGVHPAVPAGSVGELVSLVRENPGRYAYSSCGSGTPLHLAGQLLNLSAGIDLAHVGYRGCAPALLDAVSGQVPVFFNMLGNALPYERSGRLRLLAVASPARLPAVPGLPTIAESGFAGFEVYPWYGVLAPAGTPRTIVERLNAAISAALGSADVAERLRAASFEPAAATSAAFAALVRADLERWTRVVREAHVQPD